MKAFDLADKDHSGKLTYHELSTILRYHGANPTQADLNVCVSYRFYMRLQYLSTHFPPFSFSLCAFSRSTCRWSLACANQAEFRVARVRLNDVFFFRYLAHFIGATFFFPIPSVYTQKNNKKHQHHPQKKDAD